MALTNVLDVLFNSFTFVLRLYQEILFLSCNLEETTTLLGYSACQTKSEEVFGVLSSYQSIGHAECCLNEDPQRQLNVDRDPDWDQLGDVNKLQA